MTTERLLDFPRACLVKEITSQDFIFFIWNVALLWRPTCVRYGKIIYIIMIWMTQIPFNKKEDINSVNMPRQYYVCLTLNCAIGKGRKALDTYISFCLWVFVFCFFCCQLFDFRGDFYSNCDAVNLVWSKHQVN